MPDFILGGQDISLHDWDGDADVWGGCSKCVVVGIVRHHEKQIPHPMRLKFEMTGFWWAEYLNTSVRTRFRRRHLTYALVNTYNILYIADMSLSKPVAFRGSALSDLRDFPDMARRDAGHQLDLVQHGHEPDDWKPMNTVGQGVREIRIRDEAGAFRVVYVAKFADAIYVLHCFQKKSQKTNQLDLDLAIKRYRDLVKELAL